MLLTRIKVEPRSHSKNAHSKVPLKNKLILPQTSSSAIAVFQQMKLTQSHQIHDLHSNQFQLNIIPPLSSTAKTQPVTKKFTSPQWILLSHMNQSYQNPSNDSNGENPETTQKNFETSQNQSQNESKSGKKTQSSNANELLTVNKSQIQRILQMTVSDDKERQINGTQFKSIVRANDQLESKSAFLYQGPIEDSQQINHTTYDLRQAGSKSGISHKPKSAIIRPSQSLEQFYKQEMQIFSEYGLKPYEENRLRKIQELQKMELLKEQADNFDANETEQYQEYFNISKGKKTGGQMTKMRKFSAVVETSAKERGAKEFPQKSLGKNKHLLSRGKKLLNPKLSVKRG